MKVWCEGRCLDDADRIIVLELTDEDKRLIGNMAPADRFFAVAPADIYPAQLERQLKGLKELARRAGRSKARELVRADRAAGPSA
jgi:DNA-binding MarR family transcriptional regulator